MTIVRIKESQGGVLSFDLRDILETLGPDALTALWLVGGVDTANGFEPLDASGLATGRLEAVVQARQMIGGEELMEIALNTRQVIWGKFEGYKEAGSGEPWVRIIAFDSSWFDVDTRDRATIGALHLKFPTAVIL